MKTDHPLKQLVTTFIADFAAWWLQAEIAHVTSQNIELRNDPEAIHSDHIFLVTLLDGRTVILHIEFQGRISHKPMPLRMLDYLVRLATFYRAHLIHSVVLYVGHGAGRNDPGEHQVLQPDGTPALVWRYQVIRLWEMDAKDLLALDRPALLALIGQTRITNPNEVLPQVFTRFQSEGDAERQQRLLSTLVALIEDEEILKMVEQFLEDDELLLDTPFMRRMRKKAEAEGRAEGQQEGQQEGALTTLRQDIGEIVKIRFGVEETEMERITTRLAALTDVAVLRSLFLTALQAENVITFYTVLESIWKATLPDTNGDL